MKLGTVKRKYMDKRMSGAKRVKANTSDTSSKTSSDERESPMTEALKKKIVGVLEGSSSGSSGQYV